MLSDPPAAQWNCLADSNWVVNKKVPGPALLDSLDSHDKLLLAQLLHIVLGGHFYTGALAQHMVLQ